MVDAPPTRWRRWSGAALLLLSSATLLTLAAAPFGQFYLAWIALAPWLIAVADAPTVRGATLRGAVAGVLYFTMNVWWLWTASIPGTIVLVMYFSLYWGTAAALIRALGLLRPIVRLDDDGAFDENPGPATLAGRIGPAGCVVGVAMTWVALEWFRCNVVDGFPWLPIGVTQSSLPVMCQVADLGGPAIVSFWVLLLNGLAALAWLHRDRLRGLLPAAIIVGAMLLVVAAYGGGRLATTDATPGPRVALVQSNFYHLRGGALAAEPDEVVEFLLKQLDAQLSASSADLAVLPEAALPPINAEARAELARAPVGAFLTSTYQRLLELSAAHRTSLLVGGNAVTGWQVDGKARVGTEIRNAAFYYQFGSAAPEQRYDKTHLVPFSERAPFANGPAWLRQAALTIAAGRAAQPLVPGDAQAFKPFELTWQPDDADAKRTSLRFIAPICLEAIDPRAIAQMMRPTPDRRKPIALIANVSNDGWFATQEKHQHLQSVLLRTIEHRVPLVRSSNTGISGWVDSTGHIRDTIPANTSGAMTVQVELDDRATFYSRFGDVFAAGCIALTAMGVLARIYSLLRRHSLVQQLV